MTHGWAMRWLAAALVAAPVVASQVPRERVVNVAAAADLKFALDELMAEFRKQEPAVRIQATFGSSGNFYAQLTQHAPFDVFLSADMEYPRKLVAEGHAVSGTEFVYAQGRLVLWVPRGSDLVLQELGIQALTRPSVRKVAIANPRHAPYGRAAEAALKKLGVYDAVKDKLVLGENVAQTAQYVQTGAADVGIIALSLAIAPAMRDQGTYWELPTDSYPVLEQGGVITAFAKDRPGADAFRRFMQGPQGHAILLRYGFKLPGE